MSDECVVAVYDSFQKAKHGVEMLEESKFPADQVSFVTRGSKGEVAQDDSIQFGDETEHKAAKGAGLGGLIGLLLGTPLLTVSGVGAVLIAGPVAAGLAGAIVGGFLGAMVSWGVHSDHIRRYEQKAAEGALLVIAHGDPLQVAEAEKALRGTEADEVRLHAETSADTVEGETRT